MFHSRSEWYLIVINCVMELEHPAALCSTSQSLFRIWYLTLNILIPQIGLSLTMMPEKLYMQQPAYIVPVNLCIRNDCLAQK